MAGATIAPWLVCCLIALLGGALAALCWCVVRLCRLAERQTQVAARLVVQRPWTILERDAGGRVLEVVTHQGQGGARLGGPELDDVATVPPMTEPEEIGTRHP